MDNDIFNSMCDRYEARIKELDEKLDRHRGAAFQDARSEVCIKRGGHEFKSKSGGISMVCKFCGFVEYSIR